MMLIRLIVLITLYSPFLLAKEALTFYEQALKHKQNTALIEAEIAVKNSIKLEPNYLPARLLLGEILFRKGQAASAEKELSMALALKADTKTVIIPLARTKAQLKKHQEVIDLLEQYPSLATAPGYYLIIANAYKSLSQYEPAIRHYQLSISVHGKQPEALTNYADLLYQHRQKADAEALLQDALTQNNNYAPALLLLAEIAKQRANFEGARMYYQKVLTHDKENEAALLGSAYLLAQLNQPLQALEQITQLRELAPHNPYAKLLHATIISNQGNDHQAQSILRDIQQQILSLEPNQQSESDVLLMSAGLAYVEQNYHQAKRLYSRYLDRYGENANVRKQLAAISLQLNELALAGYHIGYALTTQTTTADIYLLGAHIYQQLKAPADYLIYVSEAQYKFPENIALKHRLALALIATNQSDKAITLLQDKGNSSLQNKTFLGYLLLQERELQQAIEITQQLLKQHPNKVEVLQLAGELSIQLGNSEDAYRFFEQALQLSPKFKPAQLALAGLKLNENNLPSAIEIYQQILAQSPQDSITKQLYADAAIKIGQPKTAITLLSSINAHEAGFQTAQRALLALYIESNQYSKALTTLTSLERYFAMDQSLLLAKATILIKMNETNQAQKILKVLYGIVYDNPTKLGTIANLQLNAQDLHAANKTLQRIKQLGSKNIYLQARLALDNDDLAQAEQILIQEDLSQPIWLELLVHLKHKQGKRIEAASLSKRLYQITDSREHLQLTTQLLTSQTLISDAISLLNAWIAKSPNDNWARAQLSQLAEKNNEQALAINALETSPQLFEQPLFLNNLANLYQASNLDKAERYARKANELSPNIAAINDSLGWILAQKQRYQEALGFLRQAIARDASNATYHYHLTIVLLQLNRHKAALSSFEQAKRLAPKHTLLNDVSLLFKKHKH